MPRLLLATTCFLLMLPCVGEDVHAASDRNRLPETVNRIERETGGRVLSAERRTRGGREVSRIKVYTPEGRIRILWDDPLRDRDARNGNGDAARERAASEPRGYNRPGYGRGIVPRPGDDAAVVRSLRPEPTPLPEPPTRRDDGTPQH